MGTSVAQLQEQVLFSSPGEKLVYATDFADTAGNRKKLVELATGAHSLFCECAFTLKHEEQAHRTQHLTTRACAEIANLAGVRHLLPFHFSKRYIKNVGAVYTELAGMCGNTVTPGHPPGQQ
jgi:ribonuclease Z